MLWLVPRLAGPVALGVGLLGLSSCQRQAPGPDECVSFAETWLRSERPQPRNPLAGDATFDKLVLKCLTEPYDRKLVECVIDGQPPDRCRVDYVRRIEARRGNEPEER